MILPLLLLLLPIKIAAKVPAVIVFGDSSVDSGNNNQILTVVKSDFAPYGRDFEGGKPTGRFSNGRIPTDFISEAFGCGHIVPAYLDPSYGIKDFKTRVCFASAGTGYDNVTSGLTSVIPLWKELEYYKDYQKKLIELLGDAEASLILKEAMYLISLGTNDFLVNYFVLPGGRSSQFTVEEYENFLIEIAANFITELYGVGARKVSLAGLPPMGCLPLERTANSLRRRSCIEKYNEIAKAFNVKLQNLVHKLNMELQGIRVVFTNPYDILLDMIQHPSKYGFESAATACCASGTVELSYICNQFNPLTCFDANKYVFWDSFHPTEKTNRIIADYVLKNFLAQFL
ncbi:hypothetical protein Scep_012690 [Stephania cephalantha]|uniref:Uncharacterized protein n=1 Tax=Stephania cephalantha TaxID=152367 RepID=A0AAP0P6Q1_9MAGN